MLLLPKPWQSRLLRDKVQLLESKQRGQSRLSAAGHSRDLVLKEDSSETHLYSGFNCRETQFSACRLCGSWLSECVLKLLCVTCGPLHGCAGIPAFYCADTPAFRWKEVVETNEK